MGEFIVFYSWQSDSDKKTNRYLIQEALTAAGKQLEKEFAASGLKVIIDEATRGEPGSPNIPTTILQKIRKADVFVADITTINSDSTASGRRVPNPNVVFELGYAVARTGWGRIVMLMNKAYGDMQEVPFDFDRYRINGYQCNPEDIKTVLPQMTGTLTRALKAILEQNPVRPDHSVELSPEQVQRTSDIETLKRILSSIHIPTLDQYVASAPGSFPYQVVIFWTAFDSLLSSSLFHLYDQDLKRLLDAVYDAWNIGMGFSHYYFLSKSNVLIFHSGENHPLDADQERDWETIRESADTLGRSLLEFLNYVRKNYPEVDPTALSSQAWQEFLAFYHTDDPSQ